MNSTFIIIFLFCLIIISSNVIQGITGFAGTLIALPFLIMLIDLETAKQVLNLLGILASILIIIKDFHYVKWRQFFTIIGWMTLGLIIGMVTYQLAPRKILLIIFPLFVLAVGIKGIFTKENKESKQGKTGSFLATAVNGILLVSAGIIHGLFVAGGPLLVVYATQVLKEKQAFRATLSATWIFLNGIMLIQAILAGTITQPILTYMGISIIPMLVGILIGNYLMLKMNQNFFMKLSYSLLILSGISLLV